MRPVAALANMVGSTNVSKISLSAGFAGPGCPMFVAHCRAVAIGLSLDGGFEPNGSLAVACSSHLFPAAGFCATATPGSAAEPGAAVAQKPAAGNKWPGQATASGPRSGEHTCE